MKTTSSILKSIQTSSPAETKQLGKRLGALLRVGDVVLLMGTLGVGKTTLVQGIAKGLGVRGEALSPTFVLAQSHRGKISVHHLDFYRVVPNELLAIGVEDYFTGMGQIEKGVVLIEWADRFKKIWPHERLEIRIKIPSDQKVRLIVMKGVGPRMAFLLKKL